PGQVTMKMLPEVERRFSHHLPIHDSHERKDSLQVEITHPPFHHLRITGIAPEIHGPSWRRPCA
ncbi:MAG: hypothetical protein R6U00_02010, partial [Prochlorococcaceae cyanobacterium]